MVARKSKPETEKPTQGDLRHNLSNSATALLGYVERVERLDEEIGGLTDDRKEVYGEAKGQGFDAAILRRPRARRPTVSWSFTRRPCARLRRPSSRRRKRWPAHELRQGNGPLRYR